MNSKTDYRNQPIKKWGMQEWEEFVHALRKKMPDERRDTWVSHHKLVKGKPETLGARFDPDLVYSVSKVLLHLLLEIYCTNDGRCFLAFASLSNSHRESTRKRFVTRLKRSAQKRGWDVIDGPEELIPEFVNRVFYQPKNLSSQSAPTACEFVNRVFCQPGNQAGWLAKDASGKLDRQATFKNFRTAVEILHVAIGIPL